MKEMTKEEKEKKFANRKDIVTSIGIGTMLGNAGFGIWDKVANDFDCAGPVITIGLVAALVTGYTLMIVNPYTEIATEKSKVKKKRKNYTKREK